MLKSGQPGSECTDRVPAVALKVNAILMKLIGTATHVMIYNWQIGCQISSLCG
jgi:hypothetical protein